MKTLDQTKQLVTECISSVFFKDDVLLLLNDLQKGKFSAADIKTIIAELHEDFLDAEQINDMVMNSNYKLSIGKGTGYSLNEVYIESIDVSSNHIGIFNRDIKSSLDYLFKGIEGGTIAFICEGDEKLD